MATQISIRTHGQLKYMAKNINRIESTLNNYYWQNFYIYPLFLENNSRYIIITDKIFWILCNKYRIHTSY